MKISLLAFLGTNDYLPCNYVFEFQDHLKIENVRFVQEAIASMLNFKEDIELKVKIFVTDESKEKNLFDNGHKDRDGNFMLRQGLETRLKQINEKIEILIYKIPDEASEEHIWQIFNTIYQSIESEEEIYFDITHAFRFLPLLAVIVLAYSKVLKNISINGLYYGAFEKLGSIREAEKLDIMNRNVPVLDLTSFLSLFDWTTGINEFLMFGKTNTINELAKKQIVPILREKKGKDGNIKNLKNIIDILNLLSFNIQTSQGYNLIAQFDYTSLKESILKAKEGIIYPFDPLLEKINLKIEEFKNNDYKNGYSAVQWCIDHDLIQQGYTILEESMTTEVIMKLFNSNEILDELSRSKITSAVRLKNKNENEWSQDDRNDKFTLQYIIKNLDNEFMEIFDNILQFRNYINHAGYKKSQISSKILKTKLIENFEKLKNL